MTIKEMEEKTGISRSNIRFYETEGLICPNRRDNGYRDYSKEDAEVLLKVKLLRSMEVPLEQVKSVAAGEKQLMDILTDLETELDRQQAHQERSRFILRLLRQSGTDFDSLDPDVLLPMLDSETVIEDAPPRLNLPWRRFWARRFDYFLYSMVLSLLLRDFIHGEGISLLLILPAMLFIEPMLLSLMGTTPGKAIFGIRVTDPDGNRLDYQTALERTWTVLWEGMALNLPLVTLYFQFKSLQTVQEDESLSWEEDSDLTCCDDKRWRYFLFVPLYLALRIFMKYCATGLGG